jgi:hypothetical protein
MKTRRRRVEVNLDELDRVLDQAREEPLSETDCEKVKSALHALAALLVRPRPSEKTSAVLPEASEAAATPTDTTAPGHGRNPAEAFAGARSVAIGHLKLRHGDRCPECGQGNVYAQKEPKVLVGVIGQAPLAATVYSLERLRCGLRTGCPGPIARRWPGSPRLPPRNMMSALPGRKGSTPAMVR